jgi:hypothetical protein
MLNWLWRLFRPNIPPAAETVDRHQISPSVDVQQVSPTPAPLTQNEPEHPLARDWDESAWENYDERVIPGNYSWTYDGITVTYSNSSWEYHEPNTYRPKALSDRFYNELSPDHVDELLSRWGKGTQKGRVREYLEQAAHVSYMRRNHSDEARSLAELLTRQCIQVYSVRCSWTVFAWRAKLLAEQGRPADAVELLTKRLDTCEDDSAREGLLKALRVLERKRGKKGKTTS